jgi:DNA-directed RNA polymerase specialized sigma24 family protein
MTSGPDDALATHELDLVTRASQGETDAFNRFYERNAPGVQLLVERLLGPGTVADSVLVEAFEKTVRRLPLLGARNSSPRLYLLTTARNGAYAALGRERPEPQSAAVAALLSLPSRGRELLALRELGLSEADCAEVAGIEPAEVGIQVARARLRLTDALEGVSLSGVFAEPRAERLLAAEAVRQDGASLPPELEQETTQLADSDSRFAAALSAVRSPSRSVGQLPPATGPSRLAPIARDRAVSAATGGARTTVAGTSAATTVAAAAPPAAATPTPQAPRTSDPYDATIGDEAAWGIVDDDDPDEPVPPAPARPTDGPELGGAPENEPWDSGTPVAEVPATPAPADVSAGRPPADDPLAAWDDALDWDDDDRAWSAGGGAGVDPGVSTDSAIAGAATPAPSDPAPTRAFDVVAAGLADADDDADPRVAPIPPATLDFGEGEGTVDEFDRPRRSPWRFLIWVISFALLFAGVAFAAYKYQQSKDSPSPPASTLEPKSTTSSDAQSTTGAATSSGSSSKSGSSKRTPTPKPSGTSTTSSGGSSSGSTGGTSKSNSSSSGSTGTSTEKSSEATSGTKSSSTGTTGATSTGGSTSSSGSTDDRTVSGGESTSGGSVRGDASTTP